MRHRALYLPVADYRSPHEILVPAGLIPQKGNHAVNDRLAGCLPRGPAPHAGNCQPFHPSLRAVTSVAIQGGWIRLNRTRRRLRSGVFGVLRAPSAPGSSRSRNEGARLRNRCRYGELDCVVERTAVSPATAGGAAAGRACRRGCGRRQIAHSRCRCAL